MVAGARSWLAIAAVQLVTSVLVTWPLVTRLGDGLPQGGEGEATVPFFNLWSLEWTAHNLPFHWSRWWDAPIFWPSSGSYARSELQPLTGLVHRVLTVVLSPAASYGVLVLLALTLNGVAGHALARRLGATWGAAAFAGVLVQLTPFLHRQLGVLQLLMLWPVLGAACLLLAWAERPRLRTAAALGAMLAAGLLTCSYHAALFAMAAAPAALVLLRRSWRAEWRSRLSGALLAAAVFAAVAAPFAVTQGNVLGDTVWAHSTIEGGSAEWRELWHGGRHWPGTVVVLLAVVAVVLHRRRRAVWFVTGLAVVALVLSLGMHLGVGDVRPYEWLVDHVDAVARMRSPFRAVALAQACLAVLAALGVDHLRRTATPLAVGAGLLATLAVGGASIGSGPMAALPDVHTDWSNWLHDHPGGAVVVMPMPTARPASAFVHTTEWMLMGLAHGHPLVNGYTGFFPQGDRDFRLRMGTFPSAESVAELRELGVRYVVADGEWWTSKRQLAAEALGLELVQGGPDGTLIDLQESSPTGN